MPRTRRVNRTTQGQARAIDAWMPTYDVTEYHQVEVVATPQEAYAAVSRMDLAHDPLVRMLFAMRGLGRASTRRTFTLDGFVKGGFTLLHEEAGREIVLGVTGQFWKPSGALVRLTPEEFAAFSASGHAQSVWSFHVAPSNRGCVVSTETRVRTTDDSARRAFRRYWRVVGPFSALIRRRALRVVTASRRSGTVRRAHPSRRRAVPPGLG